MIKKVNLPIILLFILTLEILYLHFLFCMSIHLLKVLLGFVGYSVLYLTLIVVLIVRTKILKEQVITPLVFRFFFAISLFFVIFQVDFLEIHFDHHIYYNFPKAHIVLLSFLLVSWYSFTYIVNNNLKHNFPVLDKIKYCLHLGAILSFLGIISYFLFIKNDNVIFLRMQGTYIENQESIFKFKESIVSGFENDDSLYTVVYKDHHIEKLNAYWDHRLGYIVDDYLMNHDIVNNSQIMALMVLLNVLWLYTLLNKKGKLEYKN